jgi:amino-acid N-acetyltransferase
VSAFVANPRERATLSFIDFFRSTAPYIHAHRNKSLVLFVTGEALAHANASNLVPDIALLNSLGLRIVLVFGSTPQVAGALAQGGSDNTALWNSQPIDRDRMRTIVEVQSSLRTSIEAQFSLGLVNSPMHNAKVRCISGNFIQAQPLGVINGVDQEYAGRVRNIDHQAINQQLDHRSIVLIPASGYSSTGEIFSLLPHDIAVSTAAALHADKLIILNTAHDINQNPTLRELSIARSELLLAGLTQKSAEATDLSAAIKSCQLGIARCHMLSVDQDGSLLNELFTRDGTGLLVTNEAYDSVRQATINDVAGIMQLLEPLEAQGILVKRSRELLEQEIAHFVVNERDGMIIGCAALYPFGDHTAELACVAVHEHYRHSHRGDHLLKAIETMAKTQGIQQIFVLTTQTAHWFIERGFEASTVSALPDRKKDLYNFQRNSKVFCRHLA